MEIQIQSSDGSRDASAIQKIIDATKKCEGSLKRTTSQTVSALMVNTIKALHNNTLVASPSRGRTIDIIDITSQFWNAFKKSFTKTLGDNPSQVKFNGKDFPVYWNKSIFNKDRKRSKTKKVVMNAYLCKDIRSNELTTEYIVVTDTERNAKKFAIEYHNRRVKRHQGLARLALEIARARVLDESFNRGNTSEESQGVASKEVDVTKQEQGFNDGKVYMEVKDKIGYSPFALKSGAGFVSEALHRALNKMTAYIKHSFKDKDKSLYDSIEIPFPELVQASKV